MVLRLPSWLGPFRFARDLDGGHRVTGGADAVVARLRRGSWPCAEAGRAEGGRDPAIACEVRILASRQRGLRHPVFVRFRTDKAWKLNLKAEESRTSRGNNRPPARRRFRPLNVAN